MLAKESPHLTLVHCDVVKTMFEKEISTIGSVLARKPSNPPIPLPPKKRLPTVRSLSEFPALQLIKGSTKQQCKSNNFSKPISQTFLSSCVSSVVVQINRQFHLELKPLVEAEVNISTAKNKPCIVGHSDYTL